MTNPIFFEVGGVAVNLSQTSYIKYCSNSVYWDIVAVMLDGKVVELVKGLPNEELARSLSHSLFQEVYDDGHTSLSWSEVGDKVGEIIETMEELDSPNLETSNKFFEENWGNEYEDVDDDNEEPHPYVSMDSETTGLVWLGQRLTLGNLQSLGVAQHTKRYVWDKPSFYVYGQFHIGETFIFKDGFESNCTAMNFRNGLDCAFRQGKLVFTDDDVADILRLGGSYTVR